MEGRCRGNRFHSKQEGNCILRKAKRATEDNGNTTAHKLWGSDRKRGLCMINRGLEVTLISLGASLMAQMVKNLPATQEN